MGLLVQNQDHKLEFEATTKLVHIKTRPAKGVIMHFISSIDNLQCKVAQSLQDLQTAWVQCLILDRRNILDLNPLLDGGNRSNQLIFNPIVIVLAYLLHYCLVENSFLEEILSQVTLYCN